MLEMTAAELAAYLRRIRGARTLRALQTLRCEIERAFKDDEATPRLPGMIAAKVTRLTRAN